MVCADCGGLASGCPCRRNSSRISMGIVPGLWTYRLLVCASTPRLWATQGRTTVLASGCTTPETLNVLDADAVLAPLPMFSVTVKVPAVWKVCVTAAPVPLPPSPKLHDTLTGLPVLVLVNATAWPIEAVQVSAPQEALVWKLAPSGVWFVPVTLNVLDSDAVLAPLPTFSVTVKVPVVWKVCVAAAPLAVPPSPKLHARVVGLPVLVLVKVTAWPASAVQTLSPNSLMQLALVLKLAPSGGSPVPTTTVFVAEDSQNGAGGQFPGPVTLSCTR